MVYSSILWYVDSRAEAASEAPAIEFWSCSADSNASAGWTFYSRDLSILALASRSAWRVSFAIPRMIWSLMYISDRSCLHEGHVKLQSTAMALRRTK